MRKQILIITIVLMVFISGCGKGENEKIIEAGNVGDLDTADIQIKEIDYSYENEDLHFAIQIPETFGDYGVEVRDGYWDGPAKVYKAVLFGVKTNDINWNVFNYNKAEVFRIMIYKTDDWRKYLNTGLPTPEVLATTDELVYAYYTKMDFPKGINFSQNEIIKILDSFELLSGNVIPKIEPEISNEVPQGDD